MTQSEYIKTYVHQKFGKREPDPFGSPLSASMALEEVERLIKWLGYVFDNEFSDMETKRIVRNAKKFASVLQPIASKHLG